MNKLSEITDAVKKTEDAINETPVLWSLRYINEQLNPRVSGKIKQYGLENFVDKLIFAKMPAAIEDPQLIRIIIEVIKKRWRERNESI